MQNLEVLASKLTELWQKKVNGYRQTDRRTNRPTDICITRAPMELKIISWSDQLLISLICWSVNQLIRSVDKIIQKMFFFSKKIFRIFFLKNLLSADQISCWSAWSANQQDRISFLKFCLKFLYSLFLDFRFSCLRRDSIDHAEVKMAELLD